MLTLIKHTFEIGHAKFLSMTVPKKSLFVARGYVQIIAYTIILYVTYLHTCIPAYLHNIPINTCIPTQHTYLPTYLHACIPTYLHACIPACLHACIPVFLHSYIPASLHSCIPACLHSCIPACLHTCVPTYLHTYAWITHTIMTFNLLYHTVRKAKLREQRSQWTSHEVC